YGSVHRYAPCLDCILPSATPRVAIARVIVGQPATSRLIIGIRPTIVTAWLLSILHTSDDLEYPDLPTFFRHQPFQPHKAPVPALPDCPGLQPQGISDFLIGEVHLAALDGIDDQLHDPHDVHLTQLWKERAGDGDRRPPG